MNKKYNPKDIEDVLYKHWKKQGYFKPNNDTSKESFCIMLPPPNVTGNLHMGHAFQQTIIDTMVRYHRMQGKNTLWQTGTDHAGIATQMLVERKIAFEEGKNRRDYGREEFIKKIWQWKKEYGNCITKQMQRLGNSVDWDRERFTMDKDLCDAVKEVFIRLYQENLIYRGTRLVNWDPKLRTAISDLEVENRELKGLIWHIIYLLSEGVKTSDGKNYLIVATTRPETIFGDTAIAVHPEDPRYTDLIGKFVIVPLVGRYIPIVGDKHADMKKGTGCVKITPAHDFNDYQVGQRNNLPMINIFTLDGNIRELAQVYNTHGQEKQDICDFSLIPKDFQNLERFTARKAILKALHNLGLIKETHPHNITLPYGDRSGVIIEPMLTDQWYVRTSSLAKSAISAVKHGDIQFIPKQYENIYFSWMKNIQDWCISRQIWWGHRIPAWYDAKGNVYVAHNEKEARELNKLEDKIILTQDEDVLDTWFSSGIWTFATLGWPKNTKDLITYHPTNVLVSGFDIIFFWIARMIMLTTHFIKNTNGHPQVPFKTVYITGLIRDEEGQKMSKSKGNVIDPLDMIDGISLADLIKKRTKNMMHPHLKEKICERTKNQFPKGIQPHGTDALRFTLIALANTGRDINWDMNRLAGYRNFCNKLWNASRFVIINTKNYNCGFNGNTNNLELSVADRWILANFNKTIQMYRMALDSYRFDIAANILYDFTWNQFCDWYIEMSKIVINYGSDTQRCGTRNTLVTVLEALLRLAHPIIPFITETIWKDVKILKNINDETIMLQPIPTFNTEYSDSDYIAMTNDIQWIKQVIIAVRNIRNELNISLYTPITVIIRGATKDMLRRIKEDQHEFLKKIARIKDLVILPSNTKSPLGITKLVDGAEVLVPITDKINKSNELKRLKKEVYNIEIEISKAMHKLANKDFVTRAPKLVVDKERKRLANFETIKNKLLDQQKIIDLL